MKFIKRRGLVFFLLLVVVFLPGSSFAEEVSPTVEKKEETVGRVTLEQKKYPLDHYKLEADIEDGIQATGDRALHSMNNALWGFNKTVASFTLFAIDQLMSFDLIGLIAQEAGVMSERIYDLMVGTFLSLLVVIVGGTAAYRFYVNQQAGHAIKAILGSLIIMVFTFWFYEDATGNIVKLNEWGAELEGMASSANVLMTSENFNANEAYDAQEGTAVLENQLFQLMVKRPYLLLNYGTTNETEVNDENPNRVDSLLTIKPYTEEGKEQRSEIVSKEVIDYENKQMSPDYSGERFGNILITILSTFALAIPILLLASFKFLLQVWFLALVIFTAIPLVISLIPSYSETAIHHFKKVIGVLLMKGGLVLLTAVITGLVTLLYESVKMTDGIEGYAFVVFLIVLVIWGLMQYRSEIFEVASAGVIQGQQMAERMTFATADKLGEVGATGVKVPARMAVKGANFLSQKRREAISSRNGEVKESSKRQPQFHSVPRSDKNSWLVD
ncbi:CD3337/EF1877 family mobilome membrane protein [Ammoniphilus sp. 3BR4]|uniref:CD3337/EF1877 family mobilome membrane protein n=1 Tax=Ammoniphilus sp. 3BR4 TaxID=3158265 RepID=UPI003467E741